MRSEVSIARVWVLEAGQVTRTKKRSGLLGRGELGREPLN
jgi:hypothetical protein